MAVDPTRQVAVRQALVHALRADLVGPMAADEVLPTRPSRWYLAGFLVPNDTPLQDRQDPTVAESLSIDADRGDDADDEVQAPAAFLPSSMGLSFLVGPGAASVAVTVRWADYRRLEAEETRAWQERERQRRRERELARAADEGREPRAWATRTAADTPQGPASDDTSDDAPRFRYWQRTAEHGPTVPVQLRRAHDRVGLTPQRDVYLEVVVRPAPAGSGPAGTRVVSLFLVNGREPQRAGADERVLFQAGLEVACTEGFVPRIGRGRSPHPDDRRNDLQYRDHPEWAVGHGVATRALDAHDGRCTRVATTWIPQATVYRMKAGEVAGVTTAMDDLGAVADPQALAAGLSPLLSAYTTWIADQARRAAALSDPRLRATADELVVQATQACDRVRAGLAHLAQDAAAFRAFQLTNQAMAQTARRQRPDDPTPRWRLFQLAFLLLNIAGVADPAHPDRQRVELLFFPTGGGKTEAYLGVAAFTLFLRRLRHQHSPHRGAGVAVLLRYTLRLLTLDQLQRAAQLTCAMELLRRQDPAALGPHRFSVGVWVGRKATANRLADLKPVISKIKAGKPLFGEPRPLPLEACPWCDTPFDSGAFALLPSRSREPHTLLVLCNNDDCPFSADPELPEGCAELPEHRSGLPIVTVDEHVYRELPGILIGTVDKFAALPWRGASGNLFGRVRAEGQAGFIGNDERPPRAATPLPEGLPPPDLIIQDELHLITGPLGTMVGLYETAIHALCRDKQRYGPKIVASTATARRATEQIRALFGRTEVPLFPPQGLDPGDTFFATEDRRPDKARWYVGVAAPGRSMKLLSSRVYAGLLGATQRQWEAAGRPGADNPADTYMSLVAYFNALRELGGAQRILQEEVNGRTRQLSERRPLGQDDSPHFADRTVNYDVLELTSRQTTDDIAKATDLLRRSYLPRGKRKTDVLLASSMIAVGVDISRLGLMVVNGQPRTVAEYIQASSRVGRASPGLVVTAFSLYKPRDRSHYERFAAFHESFYRSIEAASVTPFSARAVDRGLAGLVVALSRHLPPRMAAPDRAERVTQVDDLHGRLAALLVARATAHRPDYPPAMGARLAERIAHLLQHWQALVEKVHEAGDALRYSPWESRKATTLLSTAVDDIEKGDYTEHLAHFRAPTSMRDVEPAVHIWVDKKRDKGA